MTQPVARSTILCVDDESEVVRGLALHLGRRFEVLTASSGTAALDLLRKHREVEVIISDMRMPGMSGAEFLSRARVLSPEAQRLLLTGETDIASAIAAVNEGQIFRFLTKPCAPPVLLRAVEEAIERRSSLMAERSGVRRQVTDQLLQSDPLTGLASRQHLLATLESYAYDASEPMINWVAFFLEVDGSEEPAHSRDLPWGDELAALMAERLRQHCVGARLLVRWGIEQFVVLYAGAHMDDQRCVAFGQHLSAKLAEPIQVRGCAVTVGGSIGIARVAVRVQWQQLIRQASSAAREARRGGRVPAVVVHSEAHLPAKTHGQMLRALREALDQELLSMHYQPIVDIVAGRIRSLEVLARWEHQALGEVSPQTFIPLAEQSGDILRLGEWMLWRSCHEGPTLFDDSEQRIAVNVSAKQLMDKRFLPHLDQCLAHSGLAPERLELELTESALAHDMKGMRTALEDIRSRGVHIAVDDFGTGYSSLSYLCQLPIDVIKVDRIFVQDFNRGGKSIIKAALNIAQDFGREVIVEGVETADMLLEMRELGARLIQGYWFTRPLPAAALAEWMRAYAGGMSSAYVPAVSRGAGL